ncbi:MAG: MurT ligase domain-containing protein [Longicatena sp.]
MTTIAILATKISSFLLHLIHRGGSLPGSIGLKICPTLLQHLKVDCPIILITGTNGKTSTSNMIAELFEHANKNVISNRKGDNLRAGITTTLVTNASLNGHVVADVVVLEVDELNIPYIVSNLKVTSIVVTNFFRDQLDRAREMEQLIQKIEEAIHDFSGMLVLNGNDPNVVRLANSAQKANTTYFGIERCISSSETTKEASEGKFCPQCGNRITYSYYQYSHIGEFHCTACDFKTPKLDVVGRVIDIPKRSFAYCNQEFHAPQGGLYTMYNCIAVLAIAHIFHIEPKLAETTFQQILVPQGRNETLNFNGQTCVLNLIKNPTGANEVLKVIEEDEHDKTILLVLNDNAQDGTDVSWIYDAFFEKIMQSTTKHIICSGKRAYDMALRLKYGGYTQEIEIHETLQDAVDALHKENQTIYVIATYTALQPVRNLLKRTHA